MFIQKKYSNKNLLESDVNRRSVGVILWVKKTPKVNTSPLETKMEPERWMEEILHHLRM